MTGKDADHPKADDGREYHLQTRAGDIAPYCILVGDPDRATFVAETHFRPFTLVGDHRGLKSYTGWHAGVQMSVVTTGMGGASTGIVLPEAVRSGARSFMHVGSCGAIRKEARVGELAVCTAAVRYDGASTNWAPIEWPAVADWRMVAGLLDAAKSLGVRAHPGIGVTTSCFNEGQARPDDSGFVSDRLRCRHKEMVKRGALFYAMEDAAIFTWCSTHGGIPVGSVNAIYANRDSNDFRPGAGIEDALLVALHALREFALAKHLP